MHRLGKFKGTDQMSRLVSDNYHALLVMSRFGISLGFGDETIDEVCRGNWVDTKTFLAIVNLLLDDEDMLSCRTEDVSISSLLSYLHKSHDYFLEFRLPGIRRELAATVGDSSTLSKAIMKYFDEYVAEVREHMMYEENTVFPYVSSLLAGVKPAGYQIDIFRKHHDRVEERLNEFKDIIIKYYPAQSTNEINSVLFDIFNCANDLGSHNTVEDVLFVPAVMKLERETAVQE